MAACVIWGSHAEQQALHPPLRQLLEERLGGFAIAAIDTERHDTPVVIEGRLTSDAYLTDNGATLRLTVDRVWLSDCPEFTRGGVSLTIVGALAAQSVTEWRAGRVVRTPGGPPAACPLPRSRRARSGTTARTPRHRSRWHGQERRAGPGNWTGIVARRGRQRISCPRPICNPEAGWGARCPIRRDRDGDPDRRPRLARSRVSNSGCKKPALIT